MEQRQTYNEKIAEELIAAIKEGTAPWQKPWKPGEAMATAPMNPITGTQYRGTNSLILRNAGYDDPRWLTYKQAQEIGAQVRKGESGHTVQYVKNGEMRDKIDDDGKPVVDENGEIERVFVKYDKPKIFSARVFNAEQIDGMLPLPPLDDRITEVSWNINERVETMLEASGADIRHKAGDRAFYSPKNDYICLPERSQFNDDSAYYATALHELGHWTGHHSRLDRDLNHPFGSIGYAKEELRAEISSFMNAQRYGVSHDPGQHASYVASWVKVLDDNPKEIIAASADASSICNYLAQYDQALEIKQSQILTKEDHQQSISEEKIYLNVPYEEKNQAKALGARWDGKAKSWYAPEGTDLNPMQKWMPQAQQHQQSPKPETYVPTLATEKTYLAVPFDEKEDAKALGARWDGKAKSWYAPEGTDLNPMQKWMPQVQQSIPVPQQSDPIREFANALQQAGLVVDEIKADGELHRVPVEGRPRGKDGAYKLHLDGRPAGYIQNFVTGHKENWHGGEQHLSPEELAKQKAYLAAQRAKRDQEREKQYKENARKATEEQKNLPKATPDHPYLVKKGLNQDIIDKLDLRIDKLGNIVVPVKNKDDEIQSLQRIGANGFKQFESGCKAQGGFTVIDESALKAQDKNEPVIISTGVATAASIHMATGEPVVVAFQDSNLLAVAEEFKAMYPYRSVFIAGDNDQHNVAKGLNNSGLDSARKAAHAVNGRYAVPKFTSAQKGKEFSDYSDLHRIAGLQAVKRQITAGLVMARANVNEDKERNQALEKSHERTEEQEKVHKHKLEDKRKIEKKEEREKKRGRSI